MQSKQIWILVFVYAMCCAMMGCKHTSDDPLAHNNWEKVGAAPMANAPILQQAAESPCLWVAEGAGGNIHITDRRTPKTTTEEVRLQTPAGMLIGSNKGEYGGSLSLVGAKGALARPLLAENVRQMLPVKSGVLVFTGLLHLSVEKGAVWLFHKDRNDNWSIKKLADLDGVPRAVHENNESALVVTSHGISRIDPSLRVKKMASLPLAQTFPNSVAEDAQGRIYVGMNAFVVRLAPTERGYASEWFTKRGCLR